MAAGNGDIWNDLAGKSLDSMGYHLDNEYRKAESKGVTNCAVVVHASPNLFDVFQFSAAGGVLNCK
jgi:hypothetical protein